MITYARIGLIVIAVALAAFLYNSAFATHSVSAVPPGGTYNVTQSVTLIAAENSTIYYTVDGTVPTNASSVFSTPIDVSTNTTVKFFAIAIADNHTSSIITENYAIIPDEPLIAADLFIQVFKIGPSEFDALAGAGFTVTPNPYTLTGSLTVEDNSVLDSDIVFFGTRFNGTIVLAAIQLGTFNISETTIPLGFGNIYDNVIVTAHETLLTPSATFHNRNVTIPITDFPPAEVVGVPPPDLTSDQFNLYKDSVVVGAFAGVRASGLEFESPISSVGPNSIEQARVETVATFESPEVQFDVMLFNISAEPGSSAAELYSEFRIPTYPDIDSSIASEVFYFVPAFVIPYGDTGNNYILTPKFGSIPAGLTLVLEQPSFVESEEAKVERVNMTIGATGHDIGFSFAITDERPPGTPEPPLDVKALFLEIDFVGDIDFSNPSSFESRPVIDILVNKTIAGFDQLPDGCVDFQLLLFNEGTEDWDALEELRNPTRDTDTQCGFTLQPEHFSKFAVGGVKGQTISTESDSERNRGGGGGGSRSTAITPTAEGDDIETSINTQSGEVLVLFTSVGDASGQLKINSNELSSFENLFDELTLFRQDNDEHGITKIEGRTYATAGEVFDIDASTVEYEGKVYVTIPYDETVVVEFGSEDNVRFVHYNEVLDTWEDLTKSVDKDANTVTGELNSLSPVTSAIILNDDFLDRDEVRDDNTMPRIMAINPSFSVSEAGQVELTLDLHNARSVEQGYIVIAQILDRQNIVQYIEWRTGSLEASVGSEFSMNWDDMEKGEYTVRILILSGLENPQLFSPLVHASLLI